MPLVCCTIERDSMLVYDIGSRRMALCQFDQLEVTGFLAGF